MVKPSFPGDFFSERTTTHSLTHSSSLRLVAHKASTRSCQAVLSCADCPIHLMFQLEMHFSIQMACSPNLGFQSAFTQVLHTRITIPQVYHMTVACIKFPCIVPVTISFFSRQSCWPHAKPATWRTRVVFSQVLLLQN